MSTPKNAPNRASLFLSLLTTTVFGLSNSFGQVSEFEWNITPRNGDWQDDFNWTNALGTPNGPRDVAIIEETFNNKPHPHLTTNVILHGLRVTNGGVLHNFTEDNYRDFNGVGYQMRVDNIAEISNDSRIWMFDSGGRGWDLNVDGLFIEDAYLVLANSPVRIGRAGALIRNRGTIYGSGEVFFDSDGVDLHIDNGSIIAASIPGFPSSQRLVIRGGTNAGRFDWDGGSQSRGFIGIDDCELDIQLDPGNDPFNGEICFDYFDGGSLNIDSDWSLAPGPENRLVADGTAIVTGGTFTLGGGKLLVSSFAAIESRFNADAGEIVCGGWGFLVVNDGQIDGPNQIATDDVELSFTNGSTFEVQGQFAIHREGRAFDWDGAHDSLTQIVTGGGGPTGPVGELTIYAGAITDGYHGEIELNDGILRLPVTNSWDLHGTIKFKNESLQSSPMLAGRKLRVYGEITANGDSNGGSVIDSRVEVVSGGAINVERDATLTVEKSLSVENNGEINVAAGGRMVITDFIHLQKASLASGIGDLEIAPDGQCLVENGGGTVSLVNAGRIDLSDRITSTTFETYEQLATGKLRLVLGPPSMGWFQQQSTHDTLAISRTAIIDGKLAVDLRTGFKPKSGDSFTILTAKNVQGTFRNLLLPSLQSGLQWSVQYTKQNINLTVVSK